MHDMINKRLQEMVAAEGPDAAATLRRLAVFRDGFSEEAAAALLAVGSDRAALQNALETLRRWQFLTLQSNASGHPARYTIDPMVVSAVDIDESAQRPHYIYFEMLARQYQESGDYPGLDHELGNLDAAFEWARANNITAAYWLYSACSNFLMARGYHERHMNWIREIVASADHMSDPYLWGAVQNSLGVAFQNTPTGNRRENLHLAITAYREALKYHTAEAASHAYAISQHNLGTAYADLAQIENRAENLWRAVAAYQQAMRYRTPSESPMAYAATQSALGLAYRYLAGLENRRDNLRRAITAHRAALAYHTPAAAPADYAATQNNLGNAYRDLAGVEHHAENLRRAVAAYQEALKYRTPDTAPLAYAATQNNLGTVYRSLADDEEPAENLRRAIGAFENALRYTTPQHNPLDHAATRSNLGSTYRALAQIENRDANLDRALNAFQEALRTFTPERAPLDYATTQANLGLAHQDLDNWAEAATCWREAERYFRQMGLLDRADMMQQWITAVTGQDDP